ncbi:hypothetical protein Pla163_11440 [Planctomycetes bacterium Pla163]|uniref:Uncharacterized protein n=1 Tax=Rohdeia mirabilis TaxID=2528008 RepID=A0A518CXT9_9BACT|nr:hypothetical protein Pla163_11440 [Planctomycetes bacterium Pla163]
MPGRLPATGRRGRSTCCCPRREVLGDARSTALSSFEGVRDPSPTVRTAGGWPWVTGESVAHESGAGGDTVHTVHTVHIGQSRPPGSLAVGLSAGLTSGSARPTNLEVDATPSIPSTSATSASRGRRTAPPGERCGPSPCPTGTAVGCRSTPGGAATVLAKPPERTGGVVRWMLVELPDGGGVGGSRDAGESVPHHEPHHQSGDVEPQEVVAIADDGRPGGVGGVPSLLRAQEEGEGEIECEWAETTPPTPPTPPAALANDTEVPS